MKKKQQTIAVVGAGASGLVAAISAAKYASPNTRIILIERLNKIGKKLLATGNGRCNLENINAQQSQYYHTQSVDELKKILSICSVQQVLDFFSELGLLYKQEEEGRIYPFSNQAISLVEVLEFALSAKNIVLFCNWEVTHIYPQKEGFLLQSVGQESIFAQKVILAAGGKAYPKLGGSDLGLQLAETLGHKIQKPYPCLTGFYCEKKGFATIKGVRAEAKVTLWANNRIVNVQQGEVQFNEQGISGYPIMQLSPQYKPTEKSKVVLDLLPQLSEKELFSILHKRRKAGVFQGWDFLSGLLNKKLGYYHMSNLLKKQQTITPQQIEILVEQLKYWELPLSAPLGWDSAQVMGGGVCLKQIDTDTFASTLQDGLYLTGEMLDVVGQCGGFNLHWAFSSGIVAGKDAAITINR